MNKTVLQGKLRRVRGGLKMRWARLADDDRRMLDGKIDQMVGLFQERYGDTREQAVKALGHYLDSYGLRQHSRSRWPVQTWPLVVMSVVMAGFATMIAVALANRKPARHDEIAEQPAVDKFIAHSEGQYG